MQRKEAKNNNKFNKIRPKAKQTRTSRRFIQTNAPFAHDFHLFSLMLAFGEKRSQNYFTTTYCFEQKLLKLLKEAII